MRITKKMAFYSKSDKNGPKKFMAKHGDRRKYAIFDKNICFLFLLR